MNYINLHNNFINYCKSTSPRERLISRNKNDIRLNEDYIYVEKHHIIPKHLNGSNSSENIISLLPEEHYIIHLIRYKAFKNWKDFKAVIFIRNGYKNKTNIDETPYSKKIGLHKHFISSYRNEHGWQSSEGRQAISKARKGTMPVIDILTGENIGSVSINHPNVLNGKWVHHSKGKISCFDDNGNKIWVSTEERKLNGWIANTKEVGGKNNPNYKEMTSERRERLFNLVPRSTEENHLKVKILLSLMKEEFKEFNKISRVWITNNFGSIQEFLAEYNKARNSDILYNQYYKFKSTKKLLAESGSISALKRWESHRKENDKN